MLRVGQAESLKVRISVPTCIQAKKAPAKKAAAKKAAKKAPAKKGAAKKAQPSLTTAALMAQPQPADA